MKKDETFEIDPSPYMMLFFENLSEKDKRLYSGMEAIRLGVHGVSEVSSFYGIHKHTVRKGKQELLSGNIIPYTQVRKKGGGRKKKFTVR